jgi:hypothetical protein
MVYQLGKKLTVFYGTKRFTAFFKSTAIGSYPQPHVSCSHYYVLFIKDLFNTILQSTMRLRFFLFRFQNKMLRAFHTL